MHHHIIVFVLAVVVCLWLLVEDSAILKVLWQVLLGRLRKPRHEEGDHKRGCAQ